MSVKKTVQRQYSALVNGAAKKAETLAVPREGWIRTIRKALGMSGTDLAERLGQTRARTSQNEAAELTGGLTLRTMKAVAEAMQCHFVYAIVPKEGKIEDVIRARALKKAEALVRRAGQHMAFENQALSKADTKSQVELVADDLVQTMPSDFWKD